MPHPLPINRDQIIAFCRRWRVTELSLFGSILRDDFRPAILADQRVIYAA